MDQLAVVEISKHLFCLGRRNPEHPAPARPAALQTEHQTRAFRRPAETNGVDAKRPVIPPEQGRMGLEARKPRVPHERAITEDPDVFQ
jgi:hypothetical protein